MKDMKQKNKRAKSLICIALCFILALGMMSTAAFADDNNGTGGSDPTVTDTTGDATDEPSEGEDPETPDAEEETQADSVVTVTRSAKIVDRFGGTVTGITGENLSGTVTVPYGESMVFTITKYNGYAINKVLVDGVNKGAVTTVTIEGDGQAHSINACFSKDGLFIMLDAGHAGKYNRGIIKSYWESQMNWSLTKMLKAELEQYPGIVVGLTKTSLNDDPAVYTRGKKAKGYDLFISIHSNWSSSKSTDYPLAIVSSKYKPALYKEAQPLGKLLAYSVKSTMGTKQSPQVWVKRISKNGKDWYGVIRGSAAVNVPGIIVEHSFHSNKTACKWLMNSTNKSKMAANEAAIIAGYYGFTKDGSVVKLGKTKVTLKKGKKKIKVSWKAVKNARGYKIYRATSKNGKYKKVKTITSSSTKSWTNKKLKSKKKYYYKVRAYTKSNGKTVYGAYSAIKCKKTK